MVVNAYELFISFYFLLFCMVAVDKGRMSETLIDSLLIKQKKKIMEIFKFMNFSRILLNECYFAKVVPKRFHLLANTIDVCPQTQKIESLIDLP